MRFYFHTDFSRTGSSGAVPQVFWGEFQRLPRATGAASLSRAFAVEEGKTSVIEGLDFFWGWLRISACKCTYSSSYITLLGQIFKLCQFWMFKQKIACWQNWRLFCVLSHHFSVKPWQVILTNIFMGEICVLTSDFLHLVQNKTDFTLKSLWYKIQQLCMLSTYKNHNKLVLRIQSIYYWWPTGKLWPWKTGSVYKSTNRWFSG